MIAARIGAAAAFLLAVFTVLGCGGPDFGEVSGKISYDGKLVEDGAIAFQAADGNSATAGGTIKDGKYTATKVPLGTMKVIINGSKVTGKKRMYDDPKAPEVTTSTEYLPAKYNSASELRYDVKAGPQTKDFDLAK